MPGLPRSRMARLLRRRNRDDSTRAADVLVVGACSALVFVVAGAPVLALVAVLASVAVVVRLARRLLRRSAVLAALGEDGGGVVVGSESGEHVRKVAKDQASREADQC